MEKVTNKTTNMSVHTDKAMQRFYSISYRMKANEIKEIAALLKKPVSGTKFAVMERIRNALCDPDYIAEIKKDLDLTKITDILTMGLRVREMEDVLKIQYDMSHVLLVAYEEQAVRELGKTEKISYKLFNEVKALVHRIRAEYPGVSNWTLRAAFFNILFIMKD